MLIDLILDRKDNSNIVIKDGKLNITKKYSPKRFYDSIANDNIDGLYNNILETLDNKEEIDVKKVLANYVIYGGYNIDIIKYIYSVNWL